ncbi:hypothetical protein [Mycolicibacterium peregrinum]|uniref:hypothetical protein n=1 Tax=Mycolicibacterium peregrinum TaxID=43304 RepID=UPI00107F641C|nr:hypothetical protein [Mycolicibacterium peregrinum]
MIDAISTLERHHLVDVEQRRGGPSVITLLNETGNRQPYAPPRGGGEADRYFQVPVQLWLTGTLQQLSAPALAMLMAVLADQSTPGAPVWWSTNRFPGRFGISPATRARGTRELRDAGLLAVSKHAISTSPITSFAPERVRSVYTLTGDALLLPPAPATKAGAEVHAVEGQS